MSAKYGFVDHILTLQQSLAHYERMLSESHPLYLQNLHIDLERARIKREFSMFVLALVTVVATPPLVVIGMCMLHNCSCTAKSLI